MWSVVRASRRLGVVGAAAYICITSSGCAPAPAPPAADVHRAEVEAWQAWRRDELMRPDGWLSLTGLYWLRDGRNSFGGDAANDLVFPGSDVAPHIGVFELRDDAVRMEVQPGVHVRHDGQPVQSVRMISDGRGEPTVAQLASLRWHVIQRWDPDRRRDRLGIRLADSQRAALVGFDGVETFPIAADWRFDARFHRYHTPKIVHVPNIMGSVSEELSPGQVVFRLGREEQRLAVVSMLSGVVISRREAEAIQRLFIAFGDETNGHETYAGGRFLWVDPPDDHHRVVIDFNRAYNPPCVFSAFATCPLPPPQNRLAFRVEAGEREYRLKE